jgi:GNAT superfamily N-acetyltransferase
MRPRDIPFKERPVTLAFAWPVHQPAPDCVKLEPHCIDVCNDRTSFEAVQAAIGWHVTEEQWSVLSRDVARDSMVFVRHGNKPVGVACALHRNDDWVELAWVAVAPDHQGRGIGKMVCSAVVGQVLSLGAYQIFGSTQDKRLAALKVYLDIGFHPVYRREKLKRWKYIYRILGKPFTPAMWGWPSSGDA